MSKNSIWITGAKGRTGSRLYQALRMNVDYKVIATDKDVDITDIQQVKQAFDLYRPNIIINCASLSDPAYCEEHETEAYRVNALGARNLAAIAEQHNARIIYLSTDDVFCGDVNRPKNEFDMPTPETVYGKSKLAGENFTRELAAKHLVIRSSWIYGIERDFMSQVLEKAKAGEYIDVPIDRIGTPTSINALIEFIVSMIDNQEYGIYHASDEGMATRHQFATAILEAYGYPTSLAVASFSGNNGAVVSTALDNLMLRMTGIHEMPQWQDDLKAYVENNRKEQ